MHVAQRRGGSPHHHHPSANQVRGEPSFEHVGEGDGGNRSRGSAVVDQRSAIRETVGWKCVSTGSLRRRHGERLESVHRARKGRYGTPAVVAQVRGGGTRVHLAEVLVPAEHIGVTVAVALARGQQHAPCVTNGAEQGEVLARLRRFGELDVVDDLPRARGVQAADHLSVKRAGERPLQAQVIEGLGVYADHGQIVGAIRTADVEARADRPALEAVQGTGRVPHCAREEGNRGDCRESTEAGAGEEGAAHRDGGPSGVDGRGSCGRP